MLTDPISDFLTRIRNASSAGKHQLTVSYSGIRKDIAAVLAERGFIEKVEEVNEKGERATGLTIVLKEGKKPLHLKRISKPGQRIYVGYKNIKRVRNGLGIALISTSSGILTDAQAREKKVGGEYLCEIY